jgi:hypothetical protein
MSKKLRIIGLAMCAVCAFMAVSAGAAQAVPNFTYTNTAGKAVIPTAAEALGIEVANKTAASELEVPGLLNLKGTSIAISGGVITGEKTATVKSISFSGVTVSSLPANCQAKGTTVADPVGTITTAPLTAELVTIGSIAYATFKPEEEKFVTVKVEALAGSGKTCPVSGNYPITGSVLATLPASGVHSTIQSLVFTTEDEKLKEPTDGLKFGTSAAYLITAPELKLSNDRPWGVDW